MFITLLVIGIANFTATQLPNNCLHLPLWYWILSHYLQSVPAMVICVYFFHKKKKAKKVHLTSKTKSFNHTHTSDTLNDMDSDDN